MRFEAEVRRIRTMADMTVDVTFNLPEYQMEQAQQLLAMVGDLVLITIEEQRDNNAVSTRNKRKP